MNSTLVPLVFLILPITIAIAIFPGLFVLQIGVGEAEPVKQLGRPHPRPTAAQVMHQPEDEQVLPTGEVIVHGRVLPREPDRRAHQSRLPQHVVPGHPGRTGAVSCAMSVRPLKALVALSKLIT